MSLNILLVSDTMIKDRTAIHGKIDPKLLYPDIKIAQDMYIHPLLGSALYTKLQSLISTNTIAGAYKTLLDDFVADCLVYYTLTDLPTTISYQFWNKGVVRKLGENTDLPSMSELVDLANKYKNRAEFYANRLRLYLRQNAAEYFPEYINPGNGIDTIVPDGRSYSCPVYLGNEDVKKDRGYESWYQGDKPNC
ncbi:DUF6712 family protein [Mucilaginibacter pedocola]|nr:hypothetical protein [Mucilaginibacter pedocola]